MENKYVEVWEAHRSWDFDKLYDMEEERIIEIITSTQEEVQELLRSDSLLVEIRTAQRYLLTQWYDKSKQMREIW